MCTLKEGVVKMCDECTLVASPQCLLEIFNTLCVVCNFHKEFNGVKKFCHISIAQKELLIFFSSYLQLQLVHLN